MDRGLKKEGEKDRKEQTHTSYMKMMFHTKYAEIKLGRSVRSEVTAQVWSHPVTRERERSTKKLTKVNHDSVHLLLCKGFPV